MNVKFQLILSKHSWFRSLRLLSEVGSHERTLDGGLHAKMEVADPKCELEMPATNPFAYRDCRRRTDTFVAVKLSLVVGPRSPASLTHVASMDMMAGLESQAGDVLKGGG